MKTPYTLAASLVILATVALVVPAANAGDPCSPGVGCAEIMWGMETVEENAYPPLECAAQTANGLIQAVEQGDTQIRMYLPC